MSRREKGEKEEIVRELSDREGGQAIEMGENWRVNWWKWIDESVKRDRVGKRSEEDKQYNQKSP
jgi:hypothetical protein